MKLPFDTRHSIKKYGKSNFMLLTNVIWEFIKYHVPCDRKCFPLVCSD